MENFTMYNPTKLFFGKDVVNSLGETVKPLGNKALLVYGGGSIKRNGAYDKVIQQLQSNNIQIFEYPGIKPNPVIEDVDEASQLARKKEVDLIIAVGGGSVIDSAKIISVTVPTNSGGWEIVTGNIKTQRSIPLIDILTVAATGTEMNMFAVVQNNKTREKLGYSNSLIYPKYSFLDPQYTLTVPKDYTAYGITDLIAHCLEAYFGGGNASLSDKFIYAIIKEAMEFGPALLDDLNNYDLRARIMYAATNALNNLTFYGRKGGDWGAHTVGHVLSVLYDVPHGASLSIVYPAWLKLQKNKIPSRITELGRNLFGTNNSDSTIKSFEEFFMNIESPIRLSQLNIQDIDRDLILKTLVKNKVGGAFFPLSEEDDSALVKLL